ncbi:hypothetical protein ASU35_15005 [Acetivibrio ethanolgignens]|uniref:Uncharacterized protein n=2 Tax=Acetivibrio ethanolgignens TaxID=290052 RepID=A0A0V8QB38_9FIRM|nr:hypothetical protein ASU35_15005 [Acetivibrio ethanolgignens]
MKLRISAVACYCTYFEGMYMKKILYLMVTLLELLLLVGSYAVNYFTVKKLGMVRWVNARGLSWEKSYPIPVIKGAVLILMIAFTILVLYLFMKQRKALRRITYPMIGGMLALDILSIGYILFSSFRQMRSYYLISILFAATAFLQLFKAFIGILVCRNEK